MKKWAYVIPLLEKYERTYQEQMELIEEIKQYAKSKELEAYSLAEKKGVLESMLRKYDLIDKTKVEGEEINIDGSIDEAIEQLKEWQSKGYTTIDLHCWGEYLEDGVDLMVWKEIPLSKEEIIERFGESLSASVRKYFNIYNKHKKIEAELQQYK